MTFKPPSSDVTPALIAQLRKLTRADMADCRAALTQAECDLNQAVVLVRERQVGRLSEQTGKDVAECQQALLDCEGDVDRALNRLRSANPEDYVRQQLAELLGPDKSAEDALDGLLAMVWRRDMTDMTPIQHTVAMIGMLRNQLKFGGFQQYYFTIGERHLAETLDALSTVGADRTALFLREASTVARGERLDTTMDALDTQLNEEPEDLAVMAVVYVRQHQAEFV